MVDFKNLERALKQLRENVAEFSIGAVCKDDYRPTDEKIEILRKSIHRLTSRTIMLKAKKDNTLTEEVPTNNMEDTFQKLQEDTAKAIINNIAIEQCLHSSTILDVMSDEHQTDVQEKMYTAMKKLFMLNDAILSTQQSVQNAFKKQLDLKIQCQKAIFDHHSFLKEKEEQRKQKLQKTNPTVVKNKEKMMRNINKINVMKKLITNFIATSGELLMKEPFLLEMLEKHAELINEETTRKITENANKDKV
ncbi:uncharacterized protein LOC124949039 [Vespa velutina]|uniref:uncharacterized protein LOC124949039 n=1 Tax=Vespa velutina TaxID=202808 RepID=UPI001FB3AD21|nr:uncharacterized protein LOC124949039 [Vespa velutina]